MPTPRIADYDEVDAAVSWSTPLLVQPRSNEIAGADASWIGTWIQEDCDPLEPTGLSSGSIGCAQLVVAADDAGQITGSVDFERTLQEVGPFAPASDPSVGYPVGLERTEYNSLRGAPAVGTPYPVRSARFEQGKLTLWVFFTDLWDSWCRLQTSHRWSVDGRTLGLCVPANDSERGSIDVGKLTLCSAVSPLECTADASDAGERCSCNGDSSPLGLASCGLQVCQCDDDGCAADEQQSNYLKLELTRDGDRLTGYMSYAPAYATQSAVSMLRATP